MRILTDDPLFHHLMESPDPGTKERMASFRAKTIYEQLKELEDLWMLEQRLGSRHRRWAKGAGVGLGDEIMIYWHIVFENPAYARFADLDSLSVGAHH